MIPDWLQHASNLDDEDAGIDIIYGTFYDWMYTGEVERLNAVLAGVTRDDLASMSIVIGVALLSASSPAAHFLPDRNRVHDLIQEVWAEELESGELDGLRGPNPAATEAHNAIFHGLLGGPPIPTEK
jgi:hypothetical protein